MFSYFVLIRVSEKITGLPWPIFVVSLATKLRKQDRCYFLAATNKYDGGGNGGSIRNTCHSNICLDLFFMVH